MKSQLLVQCFVIATFAGQVLGAGQDAAAGEAAGFVLLRNQDRISGRILSVTGQELVIETSYAGRITIRRDEVERFVSHEALEVWFKTGKRETGGVEADGTLLRVAGKEVLWADVEKIQIPPEPVKERKGWLAGWKGNVDLTYNVSRGNTNLDHFGFQFGLNRRRSDDAWNARFRTLYSRQDGTVSGDLQSFRVRYDRFVSERWFFFGSFGADRDKMESLQLRTREGGGIGYRLSAARETVLSLFAGLSAVQERFAGLARTSQSEAAITAEFRTAVLAPAILTANSELQPRLSEDRYLFNFDWGLRVPLFERLTVGLQYFTKYDSAPPSAAKRKDYGLMSTLGLQF
ncbi:MAG: DUF481 domain-containing protein [Acidobacteriota bacterium]